jgi:hypothetical protein
MEGLALLLIKEGISLAGTVAEIEMSSGSWNFIHGRQSLGSENRFQ